MRLVPALVAAVAIATTNARAQRLPDWDRYAYCQRSVEAYEGRTEGKLLNELCLGSEHDSFLEMTRRWSDLPDTIRRYCSRVSQTGPDQGSYSVLRGCVISELSALADQRLPTPPPESTGPQWYLRSPNGSIPYNSLNECSAARAKSTAAWSVCTNRY
jgi:hypothetical protein